MVSNLKLCGGVCYEGVNCNTAGYNTAIYVRSASTWKAPRQSTDDPIEKTVLSCGRHCLDNRPASGPSAIVSLGQRGRRSTLRDGFRQSVCRLSESSHLTLVASTDRVIATNAANVSAALIVCEYSHCRRAASKSFGVTVQLLLASFIGYVNIQKITCVAARQRAALRDSTKTERSLRTMNVWITRAEGQ
jgi:hypothetical protein